MFVQTSRNPHVNLGGLSEGAHWMDVVIKNDDAHHDPHTETHGVCVGETTSVLNTHTHTHTHTYTHTTHTHTHTHTRTHTHTHTHTQPPAHTPTHTHTQPSTAQHTPQHSKA